LWPTAGRGLHERAHAPGAGQILRLGAPRAATSAAQALRRRARHRRVPQSSSSARGCSLGDARRVGLEGRRHSSKRHLVGWRTHWRTRTKAPADEDVVGGLGNTPAGPLQGSEFRPPPSRPGSRTIMLPPAHSSAGPCSRSHESGGRRVAPPTPTRRAPWPTAQEPFIHRKKSFPGLRHKKACK